MQTADRRRSVSGKRVRRRAIYDSEKEARRAQILAAAQKLFLRRGGQLATVTEVAERAGVAKGTVYLYFGTKEELYISQYEELMTALLNEIQQVCDGPSDGRTGPRIVDAICEFVAAHPELMRLAGIMNGVLEQNVSEQFIERYKTRLGNALVTTVARLTVALAPLSAEQATRLLLQTYSIAVGLWQQADLPEVVRKLIERRPDLSFYRIDFARELRSALELIWRSVEAERKRGRAPHRRRD